MNKKSIEELIQNITLPIVEELEYELVDVEFIKEAGSWYLRIYIDKQNGILIDDCQKVSKRVSEKLDEIDPISEAYYLEVSSPGLTRPLKKDKDFLRNVGKEINITLFKGLESLNNKKSIEGILKGLGDNKEVLLDVNEKIISLPRNLIASAKLKIDF